MTIFITESFKINLSELSITFSEENSFFEKDLIKQQSFPFKIPRERGFIPFFEFISSHNSVEANKYIKGLLFRNDKYYEAELLVLKVVDQVEAVIYYSFDKLTIFDTPLKSLPWPEVNIGDDIYDFAKTTITKDYPETLINFVKVYDPERYKQYDWGPYDGFTNNIINGDFQRSLLEIYGLKFPVMNEMRPFIYIREIMKFIFDQIGYTIAGDFVTNERLKTCLYYHSNQIFHTNDGFSKNEELSLNLQNSNISGYFPPTVTYNEYFDTEVIYTAGSYKVNFEISGEFTVANEECQVKAYFNNQILATARTSNNNSASFRMELEFDLHVDPVDAGEALEIVVVSSDPTLGSIEGQYEILGTLRPLYKDKVSLKDLVPDVTVGKFITDIKEDFVLTSVFDEPTKTVTFNFFDTFVDEKPAIDLSKYAQVIVPRKMNRSIGYKIPFSDGEVLNLDKSGAFITEAIGFTEQIVPLEPLPVVLLEAIPNVQHQEGNSILFFESNPDALPLVDDGTTYFNRLGFVDLFLRKWFFQLLNSEEYNQTINLPISVSAKLGSQSKVWFYNNFFLVHNLKRVMVGQLFEKVTMRLFKLRSYPELNVIIDDGGDDTVYQPPTAITSNISFGQVPVLVFNTNVTPGLFGAPASFTIDIYGNGSTDPQGLDLSFGWEVISSPDGQGSGNFIAQNAEHSITRFTHSNYLNLTGNYMLRLTVVNTAGLSDFVDFMVTVDDVQAPSPSIGLAQMIFIGPDHFQASLNFDPVNTTGTIEAQNAQVNFTTGAVTPVGDVETFSLPNVTNGLNNFQVNLPAAASNYWYVKLIVDGVESNDRPFVGGTLPFNIP